MGGTAGQERVVLDLATVREGELWIADCNFCTCGFLAGLHGRDACGRLRLHGGLPFTELSAWGEAVATEGGQSVREQAVAVEGRRYRRIRVELAEPGRRPAYRSDHRPAATVVQRHPDFDQLPVF